MLRFFLILVFLIPFQKRFYQPLKKFSASLVNFEIPASFEFNFDWYVADFFLIALFVGSVRFFNWKILLEGERKYLTLFLLIALISIPFSDYPTYSLHYWRWLHLCLPAFLAYLFFSTNFTTVARVVMASSLLQCCIAIPQYFLQHSLGLKWLGEPTIVSRHYLGAHFHMADGSLSLFDHWFNVVRNSTEVIRAHGTLPHPNILGGMLVFGLLITAYLYTVSKRRKWLALAMGLQVFCLITTYSRSALFAWGLAMVIWIWIDFSKTRKLHSVTWIAFGSLALSIFCFYPQLFERGGVISYNAVAKASDMARLTMNEVAVKMIQTHPFLGVGFYNYFLAFQSIASAQEPMYIHNVYLHLATEIGIFGLVAFLVFCGALLKRGWEGRHQPAVRILFVTLVAFLAIGLADFYPLDHQQTRMVFFLTAGLLLACSATQVIPDNIQATAS
jgi:O-antigen ligase